MISFFHPVAKLCAGGSLEVKIEASELSDTSHFFSWHHTFSPYDFLTLNCVILFLWCLQLSCVKIDFQMF